MSHPEQQSSLLLTGLRSPVFSSPIFTKLQADNTAVTHEPITFDWTHRVGNTFYPSHSSNGLHDLHSLVTTTVFYT
jgi:hypothetical protein